ncbi:MAG: methyltransferase domain-containing protein [Nannocystaceae bacterium]|nr:methyltransferase domain-containing protein [Myxococcales bacterium]
MSARDWDQRYVDGDLPWDTGHPDPHLVAQWAELVPTPARVLEVGCGTGTNAIWLAERGCEVVGVDVSARAIQHAMTKTAAAGVRVALSVANFLTDDAIPAGAFDLVFDRGVFHVFDAAADRARFAERVARALAPGGQWLCVAGSTEGPKRDHGPPRRSARDITEAVEPHLSLASLRDTMFEANTPSPARAWLLRARRRDVPAVPSTVRG